MEEQNDIQGKGVYAPEVLDFVRAANEYCIWMENEESENGMQFIKSSVKILSKVYYCAVCLPDFEPMLDGGNEKYVTEQDWSSVYQKILHLLGRYNSYLRIAESDEFDRSDLVTHKISEDLADVFQDLKDFIMQYRQGIEEIMNDSIWEVMDNFEQFWGEKLLNSLGALNKLYASKVDPEYADGSDEPENNQDEEIPGYDSSFFTRLQDFNEEEI